MINEPVYGKKFVVKLEDFCKAIKIQAIGAQKGSYQMSQEVISFKHREEQLKEVLRLVLEIVSSCCKK